MKCERCGKKAITELKHFGRLCRNCFLRSIGKRVRKNIRANKIFRKDDKILVNDKLSLYFVNTIIKDLPKEVCYKKNNKKINKIIVQRTMDDEISAFLTSVFLNKDFKKNKYESILNVITDQEALLFSELKKIPFKINQKNKEIKNILNKLEIRYPETKFSLLKSAEKLNEILKK